MFYDSIILKKLIDDVALVAKISLTVFDPELQALFSSETSGCKFCSAIKQNSLHRCQLSDKLARETMETGKMFTYTCHAGLTETLVPLVEQDYVYGYYIIGQYRKKGQVCPDEALKTLSKEGNGDFETLQSYWHTAYEYTETEIEALTAVVNTLFSYAKNQRLISPVATEFFSRFDAYIMEHLSEELTIENLCAQFYVSKQQLYKIFHDNTHKTIKQYINDKRLDKALSLIITTDKPLPIIAESVGFLDYNWFIKKFKEREKLTPKQFRKLRQQHSIKRLLTKKDE